MNALRIFLTLSLVALLCSCQARPQVGKEGEPCSDLGFCLPGLECGAEKICVRPSTGDGGGSDAGADSSHLSDASHDSGISDSGHDAGISDGGDEVGDDASVADSGPDAGADGGVADTGIVASCSPSPTGKGGDMCDVPAGAFMMGCNAAVDTECQNDENPYHQVTVPAFRIDKYEVTASEYKACVTASGCTATDTYSGCNNNVAGKESHPINCVDWNQAKAYCTWAGKKLPTEAEWEKAARGTDGRKYPWGNTGMDCDHAVHSVSPCSNEGTAVVGSKPLGVSPYGAQDMVGNVWEWVEDDYHPSYTGAPANGSAWVDGPRGSSRVFRGGGWDFSITQYLRASTRENHGGPTDWNSSSGFRCSLDGN